MSYKPVITLTRRWSDVCILVVCVCVCADGQSLSVRPLNVPISRISLPVWRARLFAYSGSLLHTHRDVIKVVYYAVDPEGRCVTRVVTLRKTLRPILIKHSIVCILYVKKEWPRADGTDAKRTTILQSKYFISLLDEREDKSSFGHFTLFLGLFFHVCHDSEVKIYIVDLSETCYFRCLFICHGGRVFHG